MGSAFTYHGQYGVGVHEEVFAKGIAYGKSFERQPRVRDDQRYSTPVTLFQTHK